MLRTGNQQRFIDSRVNLPTAKSHAELVQTVEPKIKAQAFFSARVSEAHILEKLREVSDGYSKGDFGLGEARNKLKDFLQAEGYDPRQGGMRNLASTGRLNLVLKQNAAMARSAGEWARMHDPDAMKVFPFVRYHARGDSRTRSSHSDLDGNIYDKNDPFLRTHTPPWEFNCRCYLEEVTAKEAGRENNRVQVPTPPDKVTVDSQSGFSFDPAHAFEKFDLETVKSPEQRGKIREMAEMEFGDRVHFVADNISAEVQPKTYASYADEQLPSAKTWDAAPAPARVAPETARQRLEKGFDVSTGDGKTVVMDKTVLDHWEVETAKPQKAVDSRLACLDYAVDTLQHPTERWDQDTQCRYLKVFKKETNGFEGCMVCVTNDGKCRTYFLPSVKQLDKMRNGIGHQKFKDVLSTGRSATQTTEAVAAPGSSNDRDNSITQIGEKVKPNSGERRKERLVQRDAAVAKRKESFRVALETSGLTDSQIQDVLDEYPAQECKYPKVKLVSPLNSNMGYNFEKDTLNLYKNSGVEEISHEFTHVWQYKAQKRHKNLMSEIRTAQKDDWERLQKRIKPEWLSFSSDADRNRWANALFGASSFDELSGSQRKTYNKLRDAIGSVSVGLVGGNHGETPDENRAYFESLDQILPAQEALAQIRCESKYGYEHFGEIFPSLKKILLQYGLL